MNVLTAAFSELADYARDASERHGTYAAAVEIADYWTGRTRRPVIVNREPIAITTGRYEVVLRAKLYRDGLLIRTVEPYRN